MNEAERAWLARAETQYGVASRSQALTCGMTTGEIERRVTDRRVDVLFPGVYRVAGSAPTGRQRAMAATLWLGGDALVSHLTAATLLRLERVKTTELHVTIPNATRRGRTGHALHVHRTTSLQRIDRTVVDGIPCTSATRTILDCAPMLDDETLEIAFEHARRMRLTSPAALARRAEQLCGSGKPGSTAIKRLLSHQLDGERPTESTLEVLAGRLLRRSALVRPTRQLWVGRFRIDFAWVPQLFGVECEGFEVHGRRLQWKRDKRRTATLERMGWRLMFVTWEDVTQHPEETLERIAIALRNR
jgi:very-short-patch-repair endonuclease